MLLMEALKASMLLLVDSYPVSGDAFLVIAGIEWEILSVVP